LLRLENELFEGYIRRNAICVDSATQKTPGESTWIHQLRNQSVLSEVTTRHLLLDIQSKCTIAKKEVEFYEKVMKEEEIQFELQSNQYKEAYHQKVRLDTMRLMKQLKQKKIAVRMRIRQGVRVTQLDCTLLKHQNSALEETLLNKMDQVNQLNRQCSALHQELRRAKKDLDRSTDDLTRTLRAFERAVATLRKKREETLRRIQEIKKETCWKKQMEDNYHRYKLPSIIMAIEHNQENRQITRELKRRKRLMQIEKMKLENHRRLWHRIQFAQILRPASKYAPEGHSPNNTSSVLVSTDEIMKSDETDQEQEIRGATWKKSVDTSVL
ncbi:hypothetical protein T265_13994, partial [Opisthorchis viverrini]